MISTPLQNQQSKRPSQSTSVDSLGQRQSAVDQLAQAVGEHALRQVEIDQRMAARILELRDELSAAKDEIRSLHAQVDQLVHGLSQGLSLACAQSAHSAQHALRASASNLRSR